VITLSILATFVFYKYARIQLTKNGKGLKALKGVAHLLAFEKKGFWMWLEKNIDKL
jgi:hypothetical protein